MSTFTVVFKLVYWRIKEMSKLIKMLISLMVLSLLITACGPAETEAPTIPTSTEAPVVTEPPVTEAPTEATTATEPAATTAAGGEIDCKGAQTGDQLSVIYQWSGA